MITAAKHCEFITTLLNNVYAPMPRLVGAAEQTRELKEVLESSKRGTHTSILLVGDRGSGKSAVLKRALDELDKTYPDTSLVRIELNGYIQTDDVISMYEIVRQLTEAIAVEGSGEERQIKAPRFCENFEYLCDILKERMQKSRPVVFILDNFELFAMRTKQTLLYNLFDLLQANQGALAIVGMTTRKDVFDLLEKRVKSRFSHQKVHFFAPRTAKQVTELLQMALHLPSDMADTKQVEKHNRISLEILKDKEVQAEIKFAVARAKAWGFYLKVLSSAISNLDGNSRYTPHLTKNLVLEAFKKLEENYCHSTVLNMSIMELTILIALIKLEQKEIVPYNFHIIEDYIRRANRRVEMGIGQHTGNKRSILATLTNFQELGIIMAVTSSGKKVVKKDSKGRTLQEFQMYRFRLDPYNLGEYMKKMPGFGGNLHKFLTAVV